MKKVFAFALFTAGLLSASHLAHSQERAPLPNFDRRLERSAPPPPPPSEAAGTLRGLAERLLKARVRTVRIESDPVTRSPKWIGATDRFLTGPKGDGGAVTARGAGLPANEKHRAVKLFLNEHRALFGHDAKALAGAVMQRDETSPASGLRTVVWQQMLEGIPVFEGTLKAGIAAGGELVNVGSQFVAAPAAAADAGTPDRELAQLAPRIGAAEAVALAAGNVGVDLAEENVQPLGEAEGPALRRRFSAPGLTEARVTLVWLPMDEAALRLCWSVILTSKARGELFRVLVDADSGEVPLRHCLTEYISDASYRVFTGDSPRPLSPGHATPLPGQPSVVARTLVTTPALNVTASPNGWIDDGVNETRGNNVDAHLDLNQDDLADTPRPQGAAGRVFDFPLDLTLQAPAAYRDAAITNLFYWCNVVHDRFYELGFTEAAGNFQNNTFGRGGLGNDAVQADAQDGSGTNNANFSTPPDGQPGRMQMYVFTGPAPDRDGDFDTEIMIHEYAHGLSNRLVGGGVGISALQTRGMGEGWSDFYALCLLSEAGDNVDGNYASGAYASYQLTTGYDQNYFFGIRRYPYSTNLAKNPLTFKDIDPARASLHAGIAVNPVFGSGSPAEVHNQGEVWCNTLWEMRANLVRKLGFPAGNTLALQLVTDGLKLSPANPNFLQARDAIVQAELVLTGGAHRGELWSAFAKRGMGANAVAPPSSTTSGVVENFDLPDTLSVSPSAGFSARGDAGGPYSATSTAFTVRNDGAATVRFTAGCDAPWLSLSSTGSALAGSAAMTLTASLNGAAAQLPEGLHTAAVTVTNTTSGIAQTREFALLVGVIDYFTELFDTTTNDTAFQSFLFTPDGSSSFYRPSRTTATAFPTNPAGGTALPLTDDSFLPVTLTGGATVPFYGANFGTFFVGSNGYVTFVTGDRSLESALAAHFAFKRISALMTDLFPNSTAVTWRQLTDRVAVTWQNVPEFNTSNSNSFQIEMFFDGRLRITILGIGATRGLIGLSNGNGVPAGFAESDFTSYGPDNFLTLTAPAQAAEGAGVLVNAGRVTANAAPPANLIVSLSSNRPADVAVPATVTILAGQTSAQFPLTIGNNVLLDGSRTAVLTAGAVNFAPVQASVVVDDNESAILAVSAPSFATEGAPNPQGLVSVYPPVSVDVFVALTSSNPAEVLVPAGVTILAGQASAAFPITIVDDQRLDGTTTATITARVTNWTSGSATIGVLDNETANLTIFAPPTMREGDTGLTGSVSIGGSIATPLVVPLYSDDPTEITVPVSVTIPAGQTSATFPITVVNDTLADGAQTALLTAYVNGWTWTLAPVSVADNDAHHFRVSPIPSPVVRNAPVPVSISARDVNDAVITNFNQTVTFTTNRVNVPVAPASAGSFVNGVLALNLAFTANDTGVVLTVADAGGHTGTSNAFDVISGPVIGFAWNTIASPQNVDAPFAVTIRAVDAGGNLVPGFTGVASLSSPTAGGGTLPVLPANTGAFVNGEWSGNVTLPFLGNAVVLRATSAALSGNSNPFTVANASLPGTTGTVLSEDFESGILNPTRWTITGTNTFRTINTNLNTPHGGLRHMTMDSSLDLSYSRNEATLTVNLANRTGVQLRFWARAYGEEADGPPASPFPSTGADFDGVAISADGGANWYEVQALRTLTDVYAQFTVDLDAAIAARGLAFNSNFKIRFNQYDNYPIATDGIGIDDILITAVAPPSTLTVTLPAQATEGAGALSGSVSVPTAPAANLVLTLSSKSPGKVSVPPTVTISAGQKTAIFPLTVLDDSFVDGPKSVVITAVGAGLLESGASILILDNDGGALSLSLPATAVENTGTLAGTLSLSAPSLVPFNVALVSNNPQSALPPATVAVPPGTTNVSFTLTIPDDTLIDGNQTARITASAPGWTSAIADVAVQDNEGRALTVGIPASFREGDAVKTGSVSIGGIFATNLVVTLASNDPSEITVPATVTIPAGQSLATFTMTVQNDTLVDGAQPFTITASAATFTNGTAAGQVRDNEAHHFSFAPIASPQAGGGPVPAIVTARDEDDAVLTEFNAPVTFTATGSTGVLAISPVNAGAFINGVSVNSVQFATLATNVVLTASAAAGATGASNAFDLTSGNVSRFVWNAILSAQTLDTPFNVAVRAVDALGATAPNYNGVANLSVGLPAENAVIGTGATTTFRTIYTQSHDARSEAIYTAAEVGGAARLNALALNFTAVAAAGEPLTNLTIRLKHTAVASLPAGTSWDNAGWTQVYRASPAVSATGWMTFTFSTPFDYNGTGNLLVDISIDRTATASALTSVQASTTAVAMCVYGFSASANGDPLTWSGITPFPNSITERADVRFSVIKDLPLRPAFSDAFINGVWTGQVSVPIAGAALSLKAQAGAVNGTSNPIVVNAPPVIADNGNGGFTFTIQPQVEESADGIDGSVTLAAVSATDTVIALSSSAPAKIGVPASVTVPAGQLSETFPIVVLDDAIADGNRAVTIAGNIAGRLPRAITLTVLDNDALPFTLSAPATLAETATGQTGTLVLGAPAPSVVTIGLVSSDPAALQIPANVTLQPGQQTATFPITVVNDTIIDGTQLVTITASVPGWLDAAATVLLTDNETRLLSISTTAQIYEGSSGVGTVGIGGTLPADLAVTLTSSAPAQLSVPAVVIIPAGQSTANFLATAVDDTATDGSAGATITASAPTFTSASATSTALDNDVHHFNFSTIAATQTVGVPITVTVSARDVGDVQIATFASTAALSAAGSGGAVTLTPATTGVFTSGAWTGPITFTQTGANVRLTASAAGASGISTTFAVIAGPLISLTPASITLSLVRGAGATRTLTIANSGDTPLLWNIATAAAAAPPVDAIPVLTSTLANLNANQGLVRAVIPNRFAFTDGVTGNNIADGGNDMYDTGNFLGTNITPGTFLNYSDNVIASSALLGTGGQYFTRKYDGLFVFAANVNALTYFEITGNLGADGSGSTDTAILTATSSGTAYRGFVKRVFNATDPSVNHLIIVPENGTATHTFATNTDDDAHRVTNLTGVTRIYHLLFAGTGGAYIDNAAMQNIMNTFLDAVVAPDWVTAAPLSGTVAAGGSQNVTLTIATAALTAGSYTRTLTVTSNDGLRPQVSSTINLTVTAALAADADGDGLPDAWEALFGLSTADANGANGPLGDPDGDGRATALELALGSNPTAPDRDDTAPPALVTDASDGRTYLTWKYRRLLTPGAITYTVETCADLRHWRSGPEWVEEVGAPTANPDGITETVTVRALPPIGPGVTSCNLRLRVTLP